MAQTDLLLIAGFLGAGKTTLLSRMLQLESRPGETIVIVNEFGEVGIDGTLLQNSDSEVIELTSGCICCSLKSDLRDVLARLRSEYQPRKIIIESSGVTDPMAILPQLKEEGDWLTSVTVVSVVDAGIWQSREVFGELLHNQLQPAGIILLNKIDTISDMQKQEYCRQIEDSYPQARVIATTNCQVDYAGLWACTDSPLQEEKVSEQSLQKGLFRLGPEYSSTVYRSAGIMDRGCLERFLDELPASVLRVKGAVRAKEGGFFLNYASGRSEFRRQEELSGTTLVFIGWRENLDLLAAELDGCVISEKQSTR